MAKKKSKSIELYDQKFYQTNQKDIVSAKVILPYILEKIKPKSIVDFGCGSGTWLSIAQELGYDDILGFDGEYIDKQWLLFDINKFQVADLSKKIELKKKFDLAISLEVAEHISEENSQIYIENLVSAANIILFSAAIPFQDGTNHVNEQYPSYWIEKFSKYDFIPLDMLRGKFWNNQNIAFWYKQNIMLFVKKDIANKIGNIFPTVSNPIDIVHPMKLENNYKDMKNIMARCEVLNKMLEEKTENVENLKQLIYEKEQHIEELQKRLKPKVSIVVPVYNVKNYLRECLDSILNQTLQEIEVICGDGGSTDGSLEILCEYEQKDYRVKVISKQGSGYGQSVNECMDIATGEYIGIVESDDKVDSTMYEILYYAAKCHDLDWVRSDIYFYYSEQPYHKQLAQESITYNQNFYNIVLNPQNDVRPYKTGLRTWAGIYKREFLNYNHIRHNETPGGSYQDVGFYLKTLYFARRVMFLDKPFYMWRQDNPGSSIHYDSKKLVDKSVNEWNLNKEYLNSLPNAKPRYWESFNYRRYYSYLWTIEMAKGEDKKFMKNFAKKEIKEAFENKQINQAFWDDTEWAKFKKFIR